MRSLYENQPKASLSFQKRKSTVSKENNLLMKINPKMLEKAMKQMGIKSEEILAEEVIIKTGDKELVILNPQVTRINMGGQESLLDAHSLQKAALGLLKLFTLDPGTAQGIPDLCRVRVQAEG